MALNYLGSSDKPIKFSFFPILMRAFRNWPNELHSIFGSKNIVAPFFMQFPLFANNCWNRKKSVYLPKVGFPILLMLFRFGTKTFPEQDIKRCYLQKKLCVTIWDFIKALVAII